ncbi:DUF3576 domain-containing protein [Alphaproteobacteria bacterium]|nr:DUF3576 domain-containing protein [Alphaproteobacteria bacterium]
MNKIFPSCLIIFLMFFIFSCAGNREKKDNSDLYSKSQTRGAIIERAGVTMGNDDSPEGRRLQMEVAKNKLQSGGGLFGKKGGLDLLNQNKQTASIGVGMPINPYLWKASLETISFMPLSSADPFAGLIITDWYSQNNTNERCKINIFIRGVELKTSNLKVNSFCETLSEKNNWVSNESDININAQIENAILNKAKKLKLSTN